MDLILIVGSGAVGKMTVGQELMKITDFRLFHNHMMIEPVIDIFGKFNGALVNKLREDQYFAGYEMLDRLAEDIVYSVYTSTPPYDGVVTKGMISAFAPDGMYVSELIQNNTRVFTAQYDS